mmetsp:Transcript_13130/g.36288  ORF Transcript_13130/g.36288 Transcript_13130/m.36288 type:complete len:167 (-) Transcript_13130:77-577(-)
MALNRPALEVGLWGGCLLVVAAVVNAGPSSGQEPALFESFRVCGNYCGPDWCNGRWLLEQNCDTSAPPQSVRGQASCADVCCRAHDGCCSTDERPYCNDIFVHCLDKCSDFDAACTNGDVPVPPVAIRLAMSVVRSWCCGAPCGLSALNVTGAADEVAYNMTYLFP